jgi:hypothetical protein
MDSIKLLWISFFQPQSDDNGYDETKADEESMSPWLLGTNSKLWLCYCASCCTG